LKAKVVAVAAAGLATAGLGLTGCGGTKPALPSEGIIMASGGLAGTLKGTAVMLNAGFPHLLRANLDGGRFSLNIPRPDGTTEAVPCRPASTPGLSI
jgi:hypothetical protein